MRIGWRRLRPGELDHELIWLVVSLAAGLMAVVWLSLRLPWPACTFRALTGLPCMTCGATRASLAFIHGDFFAAWRLNPLATLALFSVAVFDFYAAAVLCTRAARLRIAFSPLAKRLLFAIAGGVALLNWVYVVKSS